ncbi:MAG TPA: hypothetical protein PKA63_01870 [Oligoflexia bacterium]|nr:hypothetical protein [Oligoflexia bacterium]HMP47397.1 hypothetical protein [Oligoflexia bacterium]
MSIPILQAVKSLLLLSEFKIAVSQLDKLRSENDQLYYSIKGCIDSNDISGALRLLDEQILSAQAVTVFVDEDLVRLRAEVDVLTSIVSELETDKVVADHLIHAFEAEYQKRLSPLLEKLLKARIYEAEEREASEGSEESIREREKLEQEYEEFKQTTQMFSDYERPILNPEDEQELKAIFRRLAKCFHPDKVSDNERENAQRIFMLAKDAFDRRDLPALRDLEQKLPDLRDQFVSNQEKEKESLRVQSVRLSERIEELKAQIATIHSSDVWEKIMKHEDWDDYFDTVRVELQARLDSLT